MPSWDDLLASCTIIRVSQAGHNHQLCITASSKARLNRGLEPRLHHYRENRGPEVDLMVQGESGWKLLEVKSGQMVDPSFFRNLAGLAELLEQEGGAEQRLVHGGSVDRTQQGVRVVPWSTLQDLEW